VGVVNAAAPNNTYPGATTNGISWSNDSGVHFGGTTIDTIGNFNTGDVIAIAVYGQLQLIQFRNVTQNSTWSKTYSLGSLGRAPYLLTVAFDDPAGFSAYANFYGPFVGAMPTAIPAFTIWRPEALFSEQPAKVLVFDAHVLDGGYTSSAVTDAVPMPFTEVLWGDANLDAQNNLRFTDWEWGDENSDDDDWPLLAITVQADGEPANNYIWGQWDNGPLFLIIRFHITTTNPINLSNIPILPPAATPPAIGQGHLLSLFMSCDSGFAFTWTNGRVFGTENVAVWQPIEYATFPPSVVGTVQPVIVNTPKLQATLASGSMTTTGDATGGHATQIPFTAIPIGASLASISNGNLVFVNTPTGVLNVTMQMTAAAPGSYTVYLFYSWDGATPLQAIPIIVPLTRSANISLPINVAIPVTPGAHTLALSTDANDPGDTLTWANPVLTDLVSQALFPAYTPLFPPPLVGQGGGAAPAFPPPTPPPIGAIPPGVLVGPAIAAAAVPPSVAGFPRLIFTFGSATTPPASAAFPEQTTTYPSPPIIINTTQNTNTPIWVPPPQPPPSQATTPPLGSSYNTGGVWGPPRGPALPPVVPGGTRPFMAETASEGGGGGEATMTFADDEPPPPRPRRRRR
jgi:hypothetical protein